MLDPLFKENTSLEIRKTIEKYYLKKGKKKYFMTLAKVKIIYFGAKIV